MMLPESLVLVREDAVARFRCLTGEGACHPPMSFEEAAGLLPGDFRRFYLVRAGAEPFSWARFADLVNEDLILPLETTVTATATHLATWGLPAGWRGDDEAHRIVAGARVAADEARLWLAAHRVEEAVEALVGAFHRLSGLVEPGPPSAAVRDSLRRLLPYLGCVAPATAARSWTILGLRARPTERLADGSLVDEPAPARPKEALFPGGSIDPLLAASWADG